MKREVKFIIFAIVITVSLFASALYVDAYNIKQIKISQEEKLLEIQELKKREALLEEYNKNIEKAKNKAIEVTKNLEETKASRLKEQEILKDKYETEMHLAYANADKPVKIENNESTYTVSRGGNRDLSGYDLFKATAYDLSYESCNKVKGDKYYGITASGYSLVGLTREQAMAVAVDPDVIPLGSILEIIFTHKDYAHLSGQYTAVDTGGAIKGNKIDMFLGDFDQYEPSEDVNNFGRVDAYVKIIKLGGQ